MTDKLDSLQYEYLAFWHVEGSICAARRSYELVHTCTDEL